MNTRIVPFVAVFAAFVACANPAAAQFYAQHNLVSDGSVAADLVDPALVNAWGLVSSPTSPWWVADNGTGVATVYNASAPHIAKVPLTVTIPGGAPTGIVFNGGTGFVVMSGTASGPARFIFASETGTISGWNPSVPSAGSMQATVAVPASSAVYKGLALAHAANGDFLFATNFHDGTVDVFDSSFHRVDMPGAFTDTELPAGYAPFGIRNIDGVLFVTYALQDADRHDDVPGMGHGFVDAYDTAGHLLARVASRGTLNSPWGLALAPESFGTFGGDLLIGNFGDGHIHAYDLRHARGNGEAIFRGMLHAASGAPLVIDGLWALSFGNGAAAGPTDRLFFTAGPNNESNGLFGMLAPARAPGR
jgi:uncharacterized protein (TIGR03118 family)